MSLQPDKRERERGIQVISVVGRDPHAGDVALNDEEARKDNQQRRDDWGEPQCPVLVRADGSNAAVQEIGDELGQAEGEDEEAEVLGGVLAAVDSLEADEEVNNRSKDNGEKQGEGQLDDADGDYPWHRRIPSKRERESVCVCVCVCGKEREGTMGTMHLRLALAVEDKLALFHDRHERLHVQHRKRKRQKNLVIVNS